MHKNKEIIELTDIEPHEYTLISAQTYRKINEILSDNLFILFIHGLKKT